MKNTVSIRIKNDLSELSRITEIVGEFNESHNLPLQAVSAIKLALDEIITNIISYGYNDQKEHEIIIQLSRQPGELILQIEDDGRRFNPLEFPQADTESALEDRRIGGLGIYLVRSVMDDLKYSRRGERNCLTMKKKIPKE
jgi:anti-sigma regulatory factor (Ser/Thr protein kinase)